MVSRNKITATATILLLLLILFSGCTEEKIIAPAPESIQEEAVDLSSPSLTGSPIEENMPEIKITSFSSVYFHDNRDDIYLFSWENVPGNESSGLLDYLRRQFHISWAENVQITRDDVNRTIRFFDARGSIAIKRKDDKRVYLEIKPRILFSWDDVPGNDSVRFREFLVWKFGFDWAVKAKIKKTDDGRIIKVWNGTDNLSLELNDEKTVVRVRTDGIMNYLPYVRLEDGKLNIYSDINTIQHELPAKEENGSLNIYQLIPGKKYETYKRYYAAYDLSIINNGSSPMYFSLDSLSLHDGDRIFNTTSLEPYSSSLDVLSDLKNDNKLQDATLLPGQSINGTVVFRVNSLYKRSFLLMYNTTPVTFASIEKSIEALEAAEYFNYSIALGIPPYNICRQSDGLGDSYEPYFDDCDTWANWVNRSIFETFQKSDVERMQKWPPDNIPQIEMVYALRVIAERNIIMSPVKTRFNKSELLVTDDTGEEIINTSSIYGSSIEGMAVMSNKTFTFKPQWNLNFPGMNFSNASVVRISFYGNYPISGRHSINNQDVIMDDKLNIIVVGNYPSQFTS